MAELLRKALAEIPEKILTILMFEGISEEISSIILVEQRFPNYGMI